MTKLEALTTIIKQSNLDCDGIDCTNCPFNMLEGKTYSCCLIPDELDKVRPIEMAIMDAVDEAREEAGIPKRGERYQSYCGTSQVVTVLDTDKNLKGKRLVRYTDGTTVYASEIGGFARTHFRVEEPPKPESKHSHTTPNHSNQVPDYYRRNFKGVEIQVNDITHLWELDADETQAVQYILRAKYKNSGSDELQDLRKAADMLSMAIGWKEFG